MRTDEARRLREADTLYERYGRPLEAEHRGEYVAIAPDGRTLVGPTVLAVAQRGRDAFGPGYFVFKLGERAVGRWRCAVRG
jgi:hypothetical protein